MSGENPIKPRGNLEDALTVVRTLRTAGHTAYFAGGCVRDLLLGQTPKDFDVATDAPPQRVLELFRSALPVGAAFGVILVRIGASMVEVATFRSDGPYHDGRRPSDVHFTNAEEDAKRRDFTVNGLFLDPLTDQVIDFVGGQEDLRQRVIRAVGEPSARFDEDSLRLLRAVRFSARLGFTIEPATAAAIRSHATQLRRISPERIAEELRLSLTPQTRSAAWKLLWEMELIHELFRYLPIEKVRLPDPQRFLFPRVGPDRPIGFPLALAAAAICYQLQLTDVDIRHVLSHISPAVSALRRALRLSNDERDALRQTLENLPPLLADDLPGIAATKRFLAHPESPATRLLLDAFATHGLLTERIDKLHELFTQFADVDCAPPPLLNGDQLAAAGLTPGPLYRRLLDAVYDAQLEGRVTTSEEALAMALKLADNEDP
jgi:poly(A) polymerase